MLEQYYLILFFELKLVVVIGVFDCENLVGNIIFKNIFGFGYKGWLYVINFKYEMIQGQLVYKLIEEIGVCVEMVVIVIWLQIVL